MGIGNEYEIYKCISCPVADFDVNGVQHSDYKLVVLMAIEYLTSRKQK